MNDFLEVLQLFSNRQVVVNQYQKEELIDKQGFFFDSIRILNHNVSFIKNSGTIYSIDLFEYPTFKTLEDFKHYYSFSNNDDTIEIYFP